jgi:hypothetical protein
MAQAGRHRRRPHRALDRTRGTLLVLWRAEAAGPPLGLWRAGASRAQPACTDTCFVYLTGYRWHTIPYRVLEERLAF